MSPNRSRLVKILSIIAILAVVLGAGGYYYINRTYKDTSEIKSDFEVDALPFIAEFARDAKAANARYSEKIITVRGRISDLEKADTTVNIKMTDAATGSYLIFAMQSKDLPAARALKVNDSVAVKGSCSNGTFSEILSVYSINFKRCTITR